MSGYAALVTGSSRGIGKGIALALAAEGFSIGVNAPAADAEVHETVAELKSLGVRSVAIIADVSDLSAHERMLVDAEAALGPLTTLVNNAGVTAQRRGDLLEVTPESYDRCQAVNSARHIFPDTGLGPTRAQARAAERTSPLHHRGDFIECERGFDHAR